MVKTLSEALAEAFERTGARTEEVAHSCHLPLEELIALTKGNSGAASVETASRLAAYFGADLETFLDDPRLKSPIEIAELYSRLPEDLKRQFRVYASARAAPRDPSARE